MSNLQFQYREALSPSRRVKRGFTRLGFVLAVVTLLAGGVLAYSTAETGANYLVRRYAGVECLNRAADAGRLMVISGDAHNIDQDQTGCPDAPYLTVAELQRFDEPKPSYLGLFLQPFIEGVVFALLAAAAAFLLPFGAGWILAGFFRD